MSSRTYNQYGFILILMCISLGLQVLFISTIPQHYHSDEIAYTTIASNLYRHHEFTCDQGFKAYRPPLYPFFLAGMYYIFGESPIAIRLVQALIHCISILMVFLIARLLFNTAVARLTVIIMTVYPDMLIYSSFHLTENLYILLFLISMYFMLLPPSLNFTVLNGFAAGLAILTRPLYLYIWPVAVFVKFFCDDTARQRVKIRRYALLSITAAVILLPWTFRNYRIFHHPIPLTTTNGINFWIGNNEQATGEYRFPDTNPFTGIQDEITLSHEGKRHFKRFIKEHPFLWLKLQFKKALLFFNLTGDIGILLYPGMPFAMPLFILSSLAFIFVFTAALAGIAGLNDYRKSAALLTVLILYYLIHIAGFFAHRFRLPIIPVLIIFASYGLYNYKNALRMATWKKMGVILALLSYGVFTIYYVLDKLS